MPLIDEPTLSLILWIWLSVAGITFIIQFWVTAPYGRHTKASWGPLISNRAGWVIMESPAILLVGGFAIFAPDPLDPGEWVLVGFYLLHYIHRALIYPFRTRTRGKQMPLTITLSAVFFNLVNAGSIGYWFAWLSPGYGTEWLSTPYFILGALIFLIGAAINLDADTRLLNLRKTGEKGYKIPYGGLFRWVSCPNHFGEIIEWTGFAVMCWNFPAWAFAIWTAANLIPRSLAHHRWYQENFNDYPPNRKAVIPFLL